MYNVTKKLGDITITLVLNNILYINDYYKNDTYILSFYYIIDKLT